MDDEADAPKLKYSGSRNQMGEKKFEEAMARLEEIVAQLESGELSLEESLQVFEEGMKLAKYCSAKLEEAEKKVTMLVKQGDGDFAEVPFDSQQDAPSNSDTE